MAYLRHARIVSGAAVMGTTEMGTTEVGTTDFGPLASFGQGGARAASWVHFSSSTPRGGQ